MILYSALLGKEVVELWYKDECWDMFVICLFVHVLGQESIIATVFMFGWKCIMEKVIGRFRVFVSVYTVI